MRIRLKLFGLLREEAGEREIALELPDGARVDELRAALVARCPSIERLGSRLAVSVNLEMARGDQPLSEGDEVALLPPVAGGSGARPAFCTISESPLDEAEVIERVAGSDSGGIVSFVGRVRDRARGRRIDHLEYEAYPEMAEREMQKIADEAARRWPGVRVAVAHRVGRLAIGEAAVVIAAAAAHRGEAFDACRYAIDTLKQSVPIWKKEVAVDGEYWVEEHA